MVRAANERSSAFYIGCLLWCLVCAWCIVQGLGVLAFFGSLFLLGWVFGLGDSMQSSNTTWSAYSFFNPGGKSILGGFSGEQLEAQLRGTTADNQSVNERDHASSSDAPLLTTKTSISSHQSLSTQEKIRRRSAAAAAAERRQKRQEN